jgi:small subunit ribosomal protein S13
MPRIAGVDVPADKQIRIALTYIHGLGKRLSHEVLNKVGIDAFVRAKDLSDEEVGRIAKMIDSDYLVEGRLRRQVSQNINRLKEISSYRGSRHRRGLPARGQRTKTNARTRKGPRKVVATKKSIKQMR